MTIRTLALALVLALVSSCGTSDSPEASEPEAAAKPAKAEAPDAGHDEAAHAPERPRGRPLPAFEGWTLDGAKLSISDLIGKRLVLVFFNPEAKDAPPITDAVQAIEPLAESNNFRIVGIATAAAAESAKRYVAEHHIDFPVIDDSSARLATLFGLREPVAILGVDAEGYVLFGLAGFEGRADPRAVEQNLRRGLMLPTGEEADTSHPEAPDFTAAVMDSDETFTLSKHRGKPVLLIFFLHTCPHCHQALRSIRADLESLPEEQRPDVVGVEITGRAYAVREKLKELDLDFFPVLFDEDGSITEAYGVFGGVPDIFLIDKEGRIYSHMSGWFDAESGPLMRMRLAKLGGAPVPMLLNSTGYSGNEICGVCHEDEHETWTFTTHARAYGTLVKHGSNEDPECVGCHVVGYGKTGGFTSAQETPSLENVGCEDCHGRGGPHLSPGFAPAAGSYEGVCITCHDTKHSLGFDYATFLPRISHAANRELLKLPPEEKQRILAERGRPGGSLLPTTADYVGSEACRSCHEAEFETWSSQAHATAVASLREQGKADDQKCLSCHTTGFGKPGGFPAGDSPDDHPDLARVGCESCHGPGGNHIQEDSDKAATIVSLGDKCDSCVILQICGSCHDDANDPGFTFEVKEKIEKQRHGTITPGASPPGGTGAARPADDAALLAHAFALIDEREPRWTGR